MHIAQKFEALLEMYPRPDGRRWSGQEIDEPTGGVVTRSYVTNLRKGRIENPGYEKMKAIAKAMGFAPEVWFEDGLVHRYSWSEGYSRLSLMRASSLPKRQSILTLFSSRRSCQACASLSLS